MIGSAEYPTHRGVDDPNRVNYFPKDCRLNELGIFTNMLSSLGHSRCLSRFLANISL